MTKEKTSEKKNFKIKKKSSKIEKKKLSTEFSVATSPPLDHSSMTNELKKKRIEKKFIVESVDKIFNRN